MNFGEALQALKEGKKVRRGIWAGHWYLAENIIAEHAPVNVYGGAGQRLGYTMDKMIVAFLKDDQGIAPAQPYQADLLSEDWEIAE